MRIATLSLVAAAAVLLLTSVAPADAKPQLTSAEVIALADVHARKEGYRLSDYTRFKPGYHPEIGEWIIIYDHKPDKNGMTTVGNHFSIHIDDRTKEASFLPGR